MKLTPIALLSLIALAALTSCPDPVRKVHAVGASDWGGEHVGLTVSQNSAAFEFDCAHGQTNQPLTVDKNGNFDATGTFTLEHGGPVRKDENTSSDPARYSGHIEGDTMTLRVMRAGKDLGTFTLTRNAHPILVKCR